MAGVAFLDFEASSLNRGSYPIEAGYYDESGGCGFLIRPLEAWTDWSPESEAIHKISQDMLLREGKSPADVCHELETRLAGKTVYIDDPHDAQWARVLFKHSLGRNERLILCNVMSLWGHDGCEEYRRWLDVRPPKHRAFADACEMWGFHQYWMAKQPRVA